MDAVDPLRPARSQGNGHFYPCSAAVARGILASPVVRDELLSQIARLDPEQLDALMGQWETAKGERARRLEVFLSRPVREW